MRGVELVSELLDAADHVERMEPTEIKTLLREVAIVLGDLLARGVPIDPKDDQSL